MIFILHWCTSRSCVYSHCRSEQHNNQPKIEKLIRGAKQNNNKKAMGRQRGSRQSIKMTRNRKHERKQKKVNKARPGYPFPMPKGPFLDAIDKIREGHTKSRLLLCMGKKKTDKNTEKVFQDNACVEWICLIFLFYYSCKIQTFFWWSGHQKTEKTSLRELDIVDLE